MQERFEEAMPIATTAAEVYLDEGGYTIFIVGDNVKVYIGCYPSIEDCKREIEWLTQLANSELFQQAASAI